MSKLVLPRISVGGLRLYIAKALVGKYKSAFGIFPENFDRKILYQRLEKHL